MAFFFSTCSLFSQPAYFQQEVNTTIQVKLDDQAHSLSGKVRIQYINRSPATLSFIYFHLWPNAYRDNSTALARQLLQEGKTDFYFSNAAERGYIDSLAFEINGSSAVIRYDSVYSDICKVLLNDPLKAGDTAVITTPFYVKLPDAKFSRLGHSGQAYFITQWYPKPAVFDREGWHPMPYLDQGEFCSEFGKFDVTISLPENYLLSATGNRIHAPEEEQFLEAQVERTKTHLHNGTHHAGGMKFPGSAPAFKSIRFTESNVHDFAWFADKRFYVLKEEIKLQEDDRKINAWIFFTDKNYGSWKDALSFVRSAINFYSQRVGGYPYNNVTAVDGTIMAGGGMEYPGITVIGDVADEMELDIVMAHEIGHNWFYSALGSNERMSPLMDEGVNSYFEMRYIREKYPRKKLTLQLGKDSSFKLLGLNKVPYWRYNEPSFFTVLREHTDQSIDLPATAFTEKNYGNIIYSKGAIVFDYLEDYMGTTDFDAAMQEYFREFRFRHPVYSDLSAIFKKYNSAMPLFDSALIFTNQRIDLAITKVRELPDHTFAVTVKNKTGTLLPFNICAYSDNRPTNMRWYQAFKGKKVLIYDPGPADFFKIDGNDKMPDIDRRNNVIKTRGIFRKSKPLRIEFVTALEDPRKTQLNIIPAIGANYYNGFMAGASFHNYSFYQKKFEWQVTPFYAFSTSSITGFMRFDRNFYPANLFRIIKAGVAGKSFAYDLYDTKFINQTNGTRFKNQYLNYYKIAPYISFELKKRESTSHIRQFLNLTGNFLFTDSLVISPHISETGPHKKNTRSVVSVVNYDLFNSRAIDPFTFNFNFQNTATMAKASVTFKYNITVRQRQSIELRIFAGTFIAGGLAERSYYAFRSSGYSGYQDYLFDHNFAARNESSWVGFTQFAEQDGAMKVRTPLGQSAEWLTALNIKSPFIFHLPFRLFADAVVCDGRSLLNDKYLWDAGVNLTIWKDVLEVYLPLAYSDGIRKILALNRISFAERIRFTLNIHKLAPKNFIQNAFF
jgi:hypothetical protein